MAIRTLPSYYEVMTVRDEQRLHGLLTAALVSDLAWSVAEVEEADGVGTLRQPQSIAEPPRGCWRPDRLRGLGDDNQGQEVSGRGP
jgi:hypothetical protein